MSAEAHKSKRGNAVGLGFFKKYPLNGFQSPMACFQLRAKKFTVLESARGLFQSRRDLQNS